jgi:exodeoxyribonuclease V alpha subunit
VALCAPTGKAAKRIAEVTQYEAMTVHRLLGAKPGEVDGWRFEHGPHNLLSYDVIVCDESSMLDVETCNALLQAVNTTTSRVFFIGDADQLPSVGPGQVFADLINSGRVPVKRLTHVHRAAAQSWVCRNAPFILDGDIDITTECEDFRFYNISDPERVARVVVELVTEKMPARGVSSVQVLTPQNAGTIGVESLNNYLQSKINPVAGREEEMWKVRASKGTVYQLRPKDLVLATENDYDRFVFNGEIGTITAVDNERNRMTVDFDGRFVEYDRESSKTLRLAYALTIHKAQGSEWDWVIVVCSGTHDYMWSQQLLYTAVTRAKKGVVIVGDHSGLGAALVNDDPRRRMTTLASRLGADRG